MMRMVPTLRSDACLPPLRNQYLVQGQLHHMVQLPIAANVHEDHGKRRIAGAKDPWTVCRSADLT